MEIIDLTMPRVGPMEIIDLTMEEEEAVLIRVSYVPGEIIDLTESDGQEEATTMMTTQVFPVKQPYSTRRPHTNEKLCFGSRKKLPVELEYFHREEDPTQVDEVEDEMEEEEVVKGLVACMEEQENEEKDYSTFKKPGIEVTYLDRESFNYISNVPFFDETEWPYNTQTD